MFSFLFLVFFLPIGGSRVACQSKRPDGVQGRSRPIRPEGPGLLAGRSSLLWPAGRVGAHSREVDSNNAAGSPDPCHYRHKCFLD